MQINTEGYNESTEPIDAVNILPLARFEPTTWTTPPSTTPNIDATNCATEASPKKDVQVAHILTTTNAAHVVYWFLYIYLCVCVGGGGVLRYLPHGDMDWSVDETFPGHTLLYYLILA